MYINTILFKLSYNNRHFSTGTFLPIIIPLFFLFVNGFMKYNSYKRMKGGRKVLISDYKTIGSKLWVLRKRAGLTQEELSEKAELSYRAYADIERGNVNMRIETFLNICKALNITPNDILTEQENNQNNIDIEEKLKTCTSKEKETALNLLTVYLKSL